MARKGRLVWTVVGLGLVAGGFVLYSQLLSSGTAGAQFASDRGGPDKPIAFNRERAMGYLRQIADLGPRPCGSPAMAKQQEILQKHFEAYGARVELQKFTARQRSQKEPMAMANLIARWNPDRTRRVLLCAHYDTRPIADQEPDPRNWRKPFVGANDGASGCALMMELAHHLKDLPTQAGVDFCLFDGEEYIFDNKRSEEGGDLYFFGSEHFAKEYARVRDSSPKAPRYLGAILVDMVAGQSAQFLWEQNSYAQAGQLLKEVWDIAAEVGAPVFQNRVGAVMLDDHIALNRVRIPTVDVIDADYPHWHRLTDVPANCSGETLEQVGRVVAAWMQRAR
jgi:hypothetical protein